jgi:hypothetical protein
VFRADRRLDKKPRKGNLRMRKAILCFCVLAAPLGTALHAQDFAATWQGTLPASPEQHRVVIQIAKKDSGGWTAIGCFVEFTHDDMRVDTMVVQGADLKLTMNGGNAAYHGKISADGASIAGTWTFEQHSVPLELRRATPLAAWHVPFQYQYHLGEVTYLRPSAAEARIPFNLKLAVNYTEQGAVAWTSDWKCVACHTNGSYMVVRPLLTTQLGQPNEKLRDFFVGTLNEELAADPADMRPELDSTQAVYVAAGLAIWDAHVTHRLSPETSEALSIMFKLQRADGDWTISDDNNPPLESNRYQLATVAARAIDNAPGGWPCSAGRRLRPKSTCSKTIFGRSASCRATTTAPTCFGPPQSCRACWTPRTSSSSPAWSLAISAPTEAGPSATSPSPRSGARATAPPSFAPSPNLPTRPATGT